MKWWRLLVTTTQLWDSSVVLWQFRQETAQLKQLGWSSSGITAPVLEQPRGGKWSLGWRQKVPSTKTEGRLTYETSSCTWSLIGPLLWKWGLQIFTVWVIQIALSWLVEMELLWLVGKDEWGYCCVAMIAWEMSCFYWSNFNPRSCLIRVDSAAQCTGWQVSPWLFSEMQLIREAFAEEYRLEDGYEFGPN